MKNPISHERLKELVAYDPETGSFTRISKGRGRLLGTVVGINGTSRDAKGYIRFMLDYKAYLAHRLAWFYVHGVWPKEQIDHVNHIRDDNRLVNLRECTNAENRQNIRPEGYGVSGYLGVHRFDDKWWRAAIMKGETRVSLGLFTSPEEASAAYLAAKRELHSFALTGHSELENRVE